MADHIEVTDSEKKGVQAQVAYATALIKANEGKTGWAKISACLAHPAFITILGGLLLTGVLQIYQHSTAVADQKADRSRQLREKRLAIAATLPSELHKTGTLLLDWQMARHALETSEFPHHLTRDEMFALYKSIYEAYIREPQHVGALAQVDSWFSCDPNVGKIAREMDKTFEDFEHLEANKLSAQDFTDFDKKAEDELRNLAGAMVQALSPTGTCY
jgi:hypothetical protein